jgi:hypothetical protein
LLTRPDISDYKSFIEAFPFSISDRVASTSSDLYEEVVKLITDAPGASTDQPIKAPEAVTTPVAPTPVCEETTKSVVTMETLHGAPAFVDPPVKRRGRPPIKKIESEEAKPQEIAKPTESKPEEPKIEEVTSISKEEPAEPSIQEVPSDSGSADFAIEVEVKQVLDEALKARIESVLSIEEKPADTPHPEESLNDFIAVTPLVKVMVQDILNKVNDTTLIHEEIKKAIVEELAPLQEQLKRLLEPPPVVMFSNTEQIPSYITMDKRLEDVEKLQMILASLMTFIVVKLQGSDKELPKILSMGRSAFAKLPKI